MMRARVTRAPAPLSAPHARVAAERPDVSPTTVAKRTSACLIRSMFCRERPSEVLDDSRANQRESGGQVVPRGAPLEPQRVAKRPNARAGRRDAAAGRRPQDSGGGLAGSSSGSPRRRAPLRTTGSRRADDLRARRATTDEGQRWRLASDARTARSRLVSLWIQR